MWPFSSNKEPTPAPAIQCGDTKVTWDQTFHLWEFSNGDFEYTFGENPIFDPTVLSQLHKIDKWLEDLECEIDQRIKEHLEGWCDWNGIKDLVSIDVAWLVARNEMNVSYAHEGWADLGINIVITDGRITNSYAGD